MFRCQTGKNYLSEVNLLFRSQNVEKKTASK